MAPNHTCSLKKKESDYFYDEGDDYLWWPVTDITEKKAELALVEKARGASGHCVKYSPDTFEKTIRSVA